MSTLHPTAIELSVEPAGALEAILLPSYSQHTATLEPWAPLKHPTVLDEPSSITLMLVGVVTLAAYRGVLKALTGQGAAKTSKRIGRDMIRPRRAA
jgi:hypothetical protein